MDKALKQRLVGAVVLIALAVIILPMIFGGRPSGDGAEARSIELPTEPPDLEFETRRFPVDPELNRDADTGRQGAPEDDSPVNDTAEDTVDSPPPTLPQPDEPPPRVADDTEAPEPPAEESATELAQESETPPPADAEAGQAGESAVNASAGMDNLVAELMEPSSPGSGLRYVVQVASFGNNENAVRLAGQLEEGGYAVLLDNVSAETGSLNRVRVGPYASERRAQEVAGEIRSQFSGVNPRIVDMQPDAAGPALASSDPLVRWVVQVGSFGSQENARDLVSRLREAGLSAFDETVQTDTSTIYRVRVGPYLDRDEALAVERSIADDMGIDGVVMSTD